jgi:hypothetical protein
MDQHCENFASIEQQWDSDLSVALQLEEEEGEGIPVIAPTIPAMKVSRTYAVVWHRFACVAGLNPSHIVVRRSRDKFGCCCCSP